mgnify:CR=1 FL=1
MAEQERENPAEARVFVLTGVRKRALIACSQPEILSLRILPAEKVAANFAGISMTAPVLG